MNHRLELMLAAWMWLKIVIVRVLRYRMLVSDTFQTDLHENQLASGGGWYCEMRRANCDGALNRCVE